jgi:hypothetical protein
VLGRLVGASLGRRLQPREMPSCAPITVNLCGSRSVPAPAMADVAPKNSDHPADRLSRFNLFPCFGMRQRRRRLDRLFELSTTRRPALLVPEASPALLTSPFVRNANCCSIKDSIISDWLACQPASWFPLKFPVQRSMLARLPPQHAGEPGEASAAATSSNRTNCRWGRGCAMAHRKVLNL